MLDEASLTTSFVYLVAAAALVQVAITIFLLSKHRGASFGRANIPAVQGRWR